MQRKQWSITMSLQNERKSIQSKRHQYNSVQNRLYTWISMKVPLNESFSAWPLLIFFLIHFILLVKRFKFIIFVVESIYKMLRVASPRLVCHVNDTNLLFIFLHIHIRRQIVNQIKVFSNGRECEIRLDRVKDPANQ